MNTSISEPGIVLELEEEEEKREPSPEATIIASSRTEAISRPTALSPGYDGSVGEIYKIWLINVLLNMCTLGIYSFWGKTRLRRYNTASFSLAGDRFAYLGTGKELFIGFLKALPFMAAILTPMVISESYGETLPGWLTVWILIALPALFYFLNVAIFMAVRYRMSRLSWRGIRFALDSSPFGYGFYAIWLSFLTIISLGFAKPYADMRRFEHKFRHARFGTLEAECDPRASRIYSAFMLTQGVRALCVVIAGALLLGGSMMALGSLDFEAIMQKLLAGQSGSAGGYEAGTGPEAQDSLPWEIVPQAGGSVFTPGMLMMMFAGMAVTVAGMVLSSVIYQAACLREKVASLRFGPIGFVNDVTAGRLLRLKVGNFFILLFTLGLGLPFVIRRRLEMIAETTLVRGDLNGEDIRQAQAQASGIGEGLDDVLGLDSGLFGWI